MMLTRKSLVVDSRSEDCNANRPYQPDLVLDIKLFGKRS